MPSPLISVVIPVYNGEGFVADAINSVLAQEGVEFELIVVDDGSTDATPAMLSRYGGAIAVHRQRNSGESAARNAALPHVRGELVLFLDADDLLPTDYLNRFAAVACEAPAIEVFHCGWRGVSYEDGAPLYAQEEPLPIDVDPFHELPTLGMPHIDSLLVRRSALARVGGFDPNLRVQADWDFCLRLAASGARFRGVPGNVAVVRRRPDSVSGSRRRDLAAVGLAVLERHLRGHARCPACARAEAGLREWQRAALRAEAQWLEAITGFTGRPARWFGIFIATLRRPRLIGAVLAEFTERWRAARGV
jgi:glycosyltransferase involved in cell wall biosynthesis